MDQRKNPTIAFLWRPEEMNPEVIETARLTGTRAIFDLTGEESLDARDGLLGTANANRCPRTSWSALHGLRKAGSRTCWYREGIGNVWVEIQPPGFSTATCRPF